MPSVVINSSKEPVDRLEFDMVKKLTLCQVSPEVCAGNDIQTYKEGPSVSDTDSLRIKGGYPLYGSIKIDGAKNGVLPLMTAALLTNEPLVLTNVPDIVDVRHMLKLLTILGVEGAETVDKKLGTRTLDLWFRGNVESIRVTLQSPDSVQEVLELSKKFRASYFILGPLVGRFGVGILAHSGGCSLGSRPTNFHVDVMKAFGADVQEGEDFRRMFIPEWRIKYDLVRGSGVNAYYEGRKYSFPKISVGATINAILAAVMMEWKTHLSNCAVEPEVLDLCVCLRKMGAAIDVRAREIHVMGVRFLNGTTHRVIPDRIEAGTFMIAAAATKGKVLLTNIENPYPLVGSLGDLLSQAGFAVTYGENSVRVSHCDACSSCDSVAIRNPYTPVAETIREIRTMEYPGFPTDLQSQMLVLLSSWDGITNCRIVENIWEDRFKQVPELRKMGAQIEIVSPNEAIIERGKKLRGVTVIASDLRDAAALCIAGLSTAKGEVTLVRNTHHLNRGYSSFEEKLKNCGAQIERVQKDSCITRDCHWACNVNCSRKGANSDSLILVPAIYAFLCS